MQNCIVCKEFADERFEVEVKDKVVDTSIKGFVCRFCYNKFVDSFYNRGFFKVAKMVNWLKKKYHMRAI
jgi:hypothetical protein